MRLIDRIRALFRREPPLDWQMAMIEEMKRRGVIPAGAVPNVIVTTHPRGAHPGEAIERRDQAGLERHGLDLWSNWREAMTTHFTEPGWIAGRFGVRHEEAKDRVGFPFGLAKGDLCVWSKSLPICRFDEEFEEVENDEALLTALAHLPTGCNVAIFCDQATAIAAADTLLSSKLPIPWDKVDTDFALVAKEAELALNFGGFHIEVLRHAHVGSQRHEIWTRSEAAMTLDKPEKLS